MLCKELRKMINKELVHKQELIKRTSIAMEALAKEHYAEMLSNLSSIPGVGKKTAMMLTVLSGGFDKFDDYRKLSSYIGICPRIFESGTSVKGKARICKMGMSRIRAMLYICSWSAKRYNKACKALCERLIAKGKAKKQALIAVANKLLKQAFAIATQKTKYNEIIQILFAFKQFISSIARNLCPDNLSRRKGVCIDFSFWEMTTT